MVSQPSSSLSSLISGTTAQHKRETNVQSVSETSLHCPMATPSNVVLVTGAAGFLGKVVLEELVRQKDALFVGSIILLIRPKHGETARQRFDKTIASSLCFGALPEGWEKSVEVIDSDLALPRCGLADVDFQHITDTATHIIHAAGCVKFNSTLSEVLSSNTYGALSLVELARSCRRLHRIVTTSTAYVSHPGAPALAQLVPLPLPVAVLYEELNTGRLSKEDALALTGHPNVYSLSKCLAEHLIFERRGNLPVTIVRPSIISAALRYPEPGWIDSRAAFAGLVLCFGNGILKVVNGRGDTKLDIIPVDEVASCLIREVFQPAAVAETLSPARIAFSVATSRYSLSIKEICQLLQEFFHQAPATRGRRFRFIGRGWLFKFNEALYHSAPLTLHSVICRFKGKSELRRQSDKALKIVKAMNVAFSHYTRRTYEFQSEGPAAQLDPRQYIEVVCEGVCQHLMTG
jgi:alcohol-forming fatty acyl-CoA reductase